MTIHPAAYRRGCLAIASLCWLTGCRGGGRIELASLDFHTIDPPAARHTQIDLHECYWWSDAAGQVWIAMQRQWTPPFSPKLPFHFQLSLALEKLPAGPALDYKVTRDTLRARVRFGPWESRFTSQVGVVALYRRPNDRLRGGLRLQAARVTSQWLGSWGRPTRYLMLASFEAVHDEQRGRPIVQATESRGWGRDTFAPSQPTTQPSIPAAILETNLR